MICPTVIFTINTEYLLILLIFVLFFLLLIVKPKKHIRVIIDLLINEQELFRTVIPDLSFAKIKTKSTVNSASRRVPNSMVLPWKTFLDEAFNASLSIDAVACKFVKPKLDSLSINSEDTAVDLFLETVGYVNGQRLLKLQTPQMWCRRNQVNIIKGEPDIIHIGAPDRTMLRSTNAAGISVLATVEVKPEQLMNQILQEIINEQVVHENIHHDDYCELYSLYNLAKVKDRNTVTGYTKYNNLKRIVHQGFGYMVVNDCRYGIITTLQQTWFMCREPENPNIFLISPAVQINQVHTSDRASFWECLRYFEDLSMLNPTTYSYPSVTLNDNDYEDPDNKDQKEKKKTPDYSLPRNSRFSPYTTGGGSEISSQTRSKSNTTGNNIGSRETKEDLLLINMKNYDRNQFIFGHMLGYGRTGNIFETTIGRKTGALKMVALYKDENKLEELLNEIKIYIGPLQEIQGVYIPRLLKFGVLHEAFVFILTSLAEVTFATMGDNITRKEKQLAIEGLQKLHSKGVIHGDIRLENIMLKRKYDGSTCVWWIDFGWCKMTDNMKDLNKELEDLKYLLGMAGTK